MSKFTFPLIKNKENYFPKKPLCPSCKKRKVWHPHSMAILESGACLGDKKSGMFRSSKLMRGYLRIAWHGADNSRGLGKDREIYVSLPIISDSIGGQSDIYFCSTKCLRKFLNYCIDELERKVKKELRLQKLGKLQYNRKPKLYNSGTAKTKRRGQKGSDLNIRN